MTGAIVLFAMAHVVGAAVGNSDLPIRARVGIGGALLLALAAVDARAIRASSYCPIGWRRQTPRALLRRVRLTVATAIWGFDTGLVVTTFRVAAVSWAAIILAALGLLPWWAGAGYGFGFTLPFLALLMRPALGRAARGSQFDPGLEQMLRQRIRAQWASATLLVASGALLLGHAL